MRGTGAERIPLAPLASLVCILLYTKTGALSLSFGTATLIGWPWGTKGGFRDATRLLVIRLMEQAIFENRIRNLLWLLRSAPRSYLLGSGLSDAIARIPAREQSTAENGANGDSVSCR